MPQPETPAPIDLRIPEIFDAFTRMVEKLWLMSHFLTWFCVIMVFAALLYFIRQWSTIRRDEKRLNETVRTPKKIRKGKKAKRKSRKRGGMHD